MSTRGRLRLFESWGIHSGGSRCYPQRTGAVRVSWYCGVIGEQEKDRENDVTRGRVDLFEYRFEPTGLEYTG